MRRRLFYSGLAVLTSLLLCVAVVAVVSSQRNASRADKASAEASQARSDAEKAAADRAALDRADAEKAAVAAYDKTIADGAARKAVAAKAAADKKAAAAKKSASRNRSTGTQCEKMKASGLSYEVAVSAWWADGSPASWDVDHDGLPCEHAYGEQN